MASMADGFYREIRAPGGAYKWHCDGRWLESSSGKTVGVVNPSTRARDFEVQACTQGEVDAAFAAAKAAQRGWARTPLWKRAALLHQAAALMREHAQPMADCLVKEIAKPAKDALTEVVR
jgi:glyceraldehyde-3-phosphate dehydrogenase (NADP+)